MFNPQAINLKQKVKVRGDAGEYDVWGIDWLNQKVYIYRASGYEWISFEKITKMVGARQITSEDEQAAPEHKIEVFITPSHDNSAKPYFWAVMEYNRESWANTGLCGWATTPIEAWERAWAAASEDPADDAPEDPLSVGKTVSWTSQAAGCSKTKTGKSLAIVLCRQRSFTMLRKALGTPKLPMSRIKFQDVSQIDRLLVAVPRLNAKGEPTGTVDYYAPPLSAFLKKSMALDSVE